MSLKHAILVLLETDPGSGYDLLKRFKERLGYFWNASHQQIYMQLKKMSQDGLLDFEQQTQSGKPDRKVYKITQDGHQALLDWIEAPVKVSRVNDALLVKMYAGHLVDSQIIQREIAQHVAVHSAMLDTFLALEKNYLAMAKPQQKSYALPYLTLRKGILGEQAWLAWAQEVEVFLAAR